MFLLPLPSDADIALCCDPTQISASSSTVNPQFLFFCFLSHTLGLAVKNLPAVQEMRFCLLVGKIPWRRKWQLTPVFLSRKPHGRRRLAGYSPQGLKEWDTTEYLHFHFHPTTGWKNTQPLWTDSGLTAMWAYYCKIWFF